jgi:hypothetical protein
MSRLIAENQGLFSGSEGEHWWERSPLARRAESVEPSPRLVIAGLVVLGLGCLAWYYVGLDVRRYMKIRSM